jgi:hypothetical protein
MGPDHHNREIVGGRSRKHGVAALCANHLHQVDFPMRGDDAMHVELQLIVHRGSAETGIPSIGVR